MELIKPILQGRAFLEDVKSAPAGKEEFYLWWLGQSGYLIQWDGKFILLDPYISDSLTRKYAATEKPHVRMTELVIRPEDLDFIEVVTSSHNHTDHLDGETLIPLIEKNPDMKMIIPEANRSFVANRIKMPEGFPIGLTDGESIEINGFKFSAVPAAHEDLARDEKGNYHYLGYLIQFGDFTIYHSGDTLIYEGMVEKLSAFDIDVALLPINGRDPKRKVAGNLNSEQAVWLGKEIGANVVIPCHYDMFTFNTADPKDFEVIAQKEEVGYKVLEGGERFVYKY